MNSAAPAFETITVQFENSTELADFLANPDNQELLEGEILHGINVFGGGLYAAYEDIIGSFAVSYSKLVAGPSGTVALPTEQAGINDGTIRIEFTPQATEAEVLDFYKSLDAAFEQDGIKSVFIGNLDGNETETYLRFNFKMCLISEVEASQSGGDEAGDSAGGGKFIEVLSWSFGGSQPGTFDGTFDIDDFAFQFDGTSNPAVPLATLFSLFGGPFLTAEALESTAVDMFMKIGDIKGESGAEVQITDLATGSTTTEILDDTSVPALRDFFAELLQDSDASLI